jgi:glycogen debranching enzyme GlgX
VLKTLAFRGPGQPWPLGSSWDGHGVNFAVFSRHASSMTLCVFDETGETESARLNFPARTGDIWHGYIPDVGPGLIYGLRADGPWQPGNGHKFNASKLLLDPYARNIVGRFEWRAEHFGQHRDDLLCMDADDNAMHALKACVVHDAVEWADDPVPHVPMNETLLYEVHVKGFSKCNPDVPAPLRGTFAGLAHAASIRHLKRLGITAVSLLPVHFSLNEERLAAQGLRNYWGYNTLGFFCVDPRLASCQDGAGPRDEFRAMVRALHREGLEVLLDVVFNHTAESDEKGPTLSFRGLDNASYYRLKPQAPLLYENFSGCGNVLDICQPCVLRLVMDSLRYWVQSMHVDGFRFDLAPVLGRSSQGFDPSGAFFSAVAQDPVLSRVKMIAEPWDIGPGGYQAGKFPGGWMEWNDRFRDAARGFWLHAGQPACTRGEFAMRLCASSDLYQSSRREPAESVNYVVSHDGFTLRDLVSYKERHNLANGEGNRDGHGHNLSFNCGVEGPAEDLETNAMRGRLQRALLATAVLAQGTPMLCAGDELGHSQKGNNNPYCQDNETTWIDWTKADQPLTVFASYVIRLRRRLQPLGSHWYTGHGDLHGVRDLTWLQEDGSLLQGDAWQDVGAAVLGCLIGRPGKALAPLMILVNAGRLARPFALPAGEWHVALDTMYPTGKPHAAKLLESLSYELAAHSLVLLVPAAALPILDNPSHTVP